MRALFAFVSGRGHVEPLVPLARAARAAGHAVLVTGRGSVVSQLDGLDVAVTGPELSAPGRRVPLRPVDLEKEDRDLRGSAGAMARRRAAAVLELCEEWRPDVVVCDEVDFGSMVAAERLGLPRATVLVIAAGSFVRPSVVGEPLAELRRAHQLTPDPELSMLRGDLVLSPFPPSFRDPAYPLPPTAQGFRALPAKPPAPPAWLAGLAERPIVYCTLGTVFNVESGDLFTRVLDGLAALPVSVVATVGPYVDPEELGVRAHCHVEPWLDQAAILPHCAAVVSHGGSGTVLGTLAHGLPSVVLPMGADQPANARRCAELGAGVELDAFTATPEAVAAAVSVVLAEPAYREAARPLGAEIAALPPPEHTVGALERLAGWPHTAAGGEWTIQRWPNGSRRRPPRKP